ncbi:MAG: LytTR family DNA-binding domain-containing protein [Paracoccaceae bacterium]
MVTFATLIALIDQTLFDTRVFLVWRVAYWNLHAALAAGLWLGFFLLARQVQYLVRHALVVPSAMLILPTVAVLIPVNYFVGATVLNRPDLWDRPIGEEILRYTLIVLVFEIMTATFLVPGILERGERRRARPQAEEPADNVPRRERAVALAMAREAAVVTRDLSHISLGGRTIDLTRLLYMKSAEHYVELITHEGTELIRASLGELAALCPPCQGVVPHRSYWVHRDAIVGMNRAEGGQFLVLSNGAEVPVARSRRSAVGDWLNQHLGTKNDHKKRPGQGPGPVQQGGACDDPHMQRDG